MLIDASSLTCGTTSKSDKSRRHLLDWWYGCGMYGTRVKRKKGDKRKQLENGGIHPLDDKKTITAVKEFSSMAIVKWMMYPSSCFGIAQDWLSWIQWHLNRGGALCLLPRKETTATKPAPAPRPTLVQWVPRRLLKVWRLVFALRLVSFLQVRRLSPASVFFFSR